MDGGEQGLNKLESRNRIRPIRLRDEERQALCLTTFLLQAMDEDIFSDKDTAST